MPDTRQIAYEDMPVPVGRYNDHDAVERTPRTRHAHYEDKSMGELVSACVDFEKEVEEIRDKYYAKDRELDCALILLRGRL